MRSLTASMTAARRWCPVGAFFFLSGDGNEGFEAADAGSARHDADQNARLQRVGVIRRRPAAKGTAMEGKVLWGLAASDRGGREGCGHGRS